jgi:hypothetical protein
VWLLLRATPPEDFDPDKFMELFNEAAAARIKAQDAEVALALHRTEHGCWGLAPKTSRAFSRHSPPNTVCAAFTHRIAKLRATATVRL